MVRKHREITVKPAMIPVTGNTLLPLLSWLSCLPDHGIQLYGRGVIQVSEKTGSKKISPVFFSQEFPADLALVVVWLAASVIAIYLPGLSETPLRIVLALPVLLFIPGYCLIAILFPKKR